MLDHFEVTYVHTQLLFSVSNLKLLSTKNLWLQHISDEMVACLGPIKNFELDVVSS